MCKYWSFVLLPLSFAACSTSGGGLVRSDVCVTEGSGVTFRGAACYSEPDIRDANDQNITARSFKRELSKREAHLLPCNVGDTVVLSIAYNAGKGVCIDCEPQPESWSGFAFVTLSENGKEVAAAEWQGGGASNGRLLLRRFVTDLVLLTEGEHRQQR